MAKLIVADDHPLFRNALINAISHTFAATSTVEADSFEATCAALEANPDTDLLLDLHMPGNCGFLGLIQLKKEYPTLPIVVISASEDPDVVKRVISFGASAYIPKSAHPVEIGKALEAVLDGDTWVPPGMRHLLVQRPGDDSDTDLASRVAQLTPQQYKVLYFLTEGWLNKQIAYDLNISEATVKAHMTAIFRKLGVATRTQVVILAQRLQLEAPVDRALKSS